jgi:non-specific protein-tyrosine kinase
MKLRKALDKAKKARQQGGAMIDRSQPVVIEKSPDRDWKPPHYDESVQAMADPDKVRENRYVCIDQLALEIEFYKVLRTRVHQIMQDKGWRTVMITSPMPGEGKTTTAVNLALTFAKSYNHTVLLVDCDLRRQLIHCLLGVDSDRGLADFLVADEPLKDFILWPGIQQITLISGGNTVQNSAELLGSERMKALVAELKDRYADRYVIFDTPPVLVGADALTVAPLVDAIVMVVEEGKTSVRDVQKAASILPREKIVGIVLNRQTVHKSEYYKYY